MLAQAHGTGWAPCNARLTSKAPRQVRSGIAHRGRPCWQALLSLRLHVAENSAGAGPRHTGFRFAHTRGQLLGAHFLFGELSLWVTQGLTLQGCSRRGSPRLRWTLRPDDWPWLALPGRPEPLALSSSRTRPRQESSSRSSARHGGVVHPDGPCHTALPLASSSDDSFPSLRNLFQESTEVTLDTLRALGMESLPFQAAFFV